MIRLDFINVGYGDAVLLRDEVRPFTMLVDCGDAVTVKEDAMEGSLRLLAADYLKREGVNKLDLVVLTHLHRDHIAGLGAVLDVAEVGEVWLNYLPDPALWDATLMESAEYTKSGNGLLRTLRAELSLLKRLRAAGCTLRQVSALEFGLALTDRLTVDVGCARLDHVRLQQETMGDILRGSIDKFALHLLTRFTNVTSLRLRLHHEGRCAVLPGDCYGYYWPEEEAVPCDILKVPHHGCKNSMTETLLARLNPKEAVICTAANRPLTPDPGILRMLKAQGANVHCTDNVQAEEHTEPAHEAVTLYF